MISDITVQSRTVTLTNSQPLLRSQHLESSYNNHWLLAIWWPCGMAKVSYFHSMTFLLHFDLAPCGKVLFWPAHPDMQENLRFLTLTHINTPTTANIDRQGTSDWGPQIQALLSFVGTTNISWYRLSAALMQHPESLYASVTFRIEGMLQLNQRRNFKY